MVAFACYLDESFRGRNYSVAGYLGTLDVWDRVFTPAWNKVLSAAPHRLSEFKASDCRQRQGEFKGWTKADCDALTAELISVIITQTDAVGISTVVRFPGVIAPGPDDSAQRHYIEHVGYRMAIGTCFYDMLRWGPDLVGQSIHSVRHVPDKKNGFHQRVIECLANARSFSESRIEILDPVAGESKLLPPIQAADLLAYETRKEIENRLDERPVSRALQRLVDGRDHFSRCAQFPELPEILRLEAAGGPEPEATLSVLYHSGQSLRAPGTWGIK